MKILIVMFLWSICFPLVVLGLPYAPHITFAALRALLAGLVLFIAVLALKRSLPRDIRIWAKLIATGIGATTFGFLGMFHASEFVAPGLATVIANTQPLMAAVLAVTFLDEQLNRAGKLGLLLSFSGIILIAFPSFVSEDSIISLQGINYIFLAAFGITISNVLIRSLAGRTDPLVAMSCQLLIGSIFLWAIALLTEDITEITWNWLFIMSLLGLAVPGTALVYWLWCHILNQTELNRANSFSFLVPVFGLGMGIVFYHEEYDSFTAAGIGMTIVGIVLVNWKRSN